LSLLIEETHSLFYKGFNSLTGSTPSEIGQLGALIQMDLGMLIYAWHPFLCYFVMEQTFSHDFLFCNDFLGNNALNGTLPSELGQLASIVNLTIGMYSIFSSLWNFVLKTECTNDNSNC